MPITDVKEFGQYIQDSAASDIDELPKCGTVGWFGPNGGFMFFEVFKPNPLDRFSTIFAIFQSDDTIRLYQLPGAKPADVAEKDWRIRPPSRWTLTRVAPTYVSEAFPSMDSIADAIIAEFDELGEESTSADAELAKVLEFIEAASPLTDRNTLLEQLGDLQHREVEDDDDDEPEAAGVGAPPAAPSAPLTPVPLSPTPPSTTEPR
jgi:hypothetical protein